MSHHLSPSHRGALCRWSAAAALSAVLALVGTSAAHASALAGGQNGTGQNGTKQNGTNQNGTVTPELGSGDLLFIGVVAGGGLLLYRRRRSSKRSDSPT
jgi:hypothetical protein